MFSVTAFRAFGGAVAAAVAIVVVAGCSSQSAGTPAAPSILGQDGAPGSTPASDRPVHGVSHSTAVSAGPTPTTGPAQTVVVTVTSSVTSDPAPAVSPGDSTSTDPTGITTTSPPLPATEATAPPSRTISIVTARVSAFDPATGQLSYVLQVRNHPTDLAPYYSDDPADSTTHQATVTPDAPIRFVFSSCTLPYGELHEGGIACTPDDLAAAAANGGFLASLDIVNGSIETVTEVFQS